MPLNSGIHKEKEIDGILCRLVEERISKKRVDFIKKILEHNNFKVIIEENVPNKIDDANSLDDVSDKKYNIWVTDVLFNPVIYVYELRLKTLTNRIVTPGYWLQIEEDGIEKGEEDKYWELKLK